MSLSLFLRWEVVVPFVEIGGVVEHPCLNFLFIIIKMRQFVAIEMIVFIKPAYLKRIPILKYHLYQIYTFLISCTKESRSDMQCMKFTGISHWTCGPAKKMFWWTTESNKCYREDMIWSNDFVKRELNMFSKKNTECQICTCLGIK